MQFLRLVTYTALVGASLPVALSGCAVHSRATPLRPASTATVAPARPAFADVTRESGIRFVHNAGASGQKFFVETMGAGVAFLDYDSDGKQDLLYLNGAALPGYQGERPLYPALYRNLGGVRFQDVTREAGLAHETYAMGVSVADYDGDGDDDVYVTAVLGPSRLFRNDRGRFTDVARTAGVDRPGSFPTSSAWLDYDKDGDLDLYVCNYVRYRSTKDDLPCYFREKVRSYCIPFAYRAESDALFQNQGNGTFKNIAHQAGTEGPDGKSLGVAVWDLNADTWPDIVVANDTTPTHAYLNQKDGTFAEVAGGIGVAYSVRGMAKAGMGIDIADDRNNGLSTLVMSNFTGEMLALYRDTGYGDFQEESMQSGAGQPSAQLLGFGVFFFDYDNDTWLDLLVANGHVQDQVEQFAEGVTYRQPPLLLRNIGGGQYQDLTARAGAALKKALVARGAAYGDVDDDGRLDVAVHSNQGPGLLWHNRTAGSGHWLKIKLVGTSSNRDGFGARVTLETGGGRQIREARSGSSYCSSSDLRLHFGLGAQTHARKLTVRWPSGTTDTLTDVRADRVLVVKEGEHP